MRKAATRKIVVDGRLFRWTCTHGHIDHDGKRRCEERLRIFLDGCKASPLRVLFRENDEWEAGTSARGLLWSRHRSLAYNLNRPATVSRIAAHMLHNGWSPESSSSPFDVVDGFPLLDAADVPSGTT